VGRCFASLALSVSVKPKTLHHRKKGDENLARLRGVAVTASRCFSFGTMRAGSSRMSLRPVGLAGVAATVLAVFGCGGEVCNHPPGNTASLTKSSSATPIGEHGNGASAQTSAPATASAGESPLPFPSGGVASASVDSASTKPMSTSIVFRGQASTATEFEFDEIGFPAISRDGKLVALAFHELQVAGPPALELGVQLRSVATGRIVYNAKFREAYQGERGEASLDSLRRRVVRWLGTVERRLTQADLMPMNPVVRDEAAVCIDDPKAIRIPAASLELRFSASRLVVRDDNARVLFDHAYPEWTAAYPNPRCVYEPYVTEVAFDEQHNVLVIRADHCSPGDSCTQGVVPNFAVVTLKAPGSR